MHGSIILKKTLFLVALVGLLGLASQEGVAQSVESPLDRPHFALGYTANAPDIMGGIGGYFISSYMGGLGIYLDAKFDLEDPSGEDNFESNLTEQEAPGDFIKYEESYQSFNVGVARPLSPYLVVYAGGGLVRVTGYALKEDPGSEIGTAGVFWVEAPDIDETRPNFMIGAFLRMSSFISTQVGFETEPRGFTIGASFRLPRN